MILRAYLTVYATHPALAPELPIRIVEFGADTESVALSFGVSPAGDSGRGDPWILPVLIGHQVGERSVRVGLASRRPSGHFGAGWVWVAVSCFVGFAEAYLQGDRRD